MKKMVMFTSFTVIVSACSIEFGPLDEIYAPKLGDGTGFGTLCYAINENRTRVGTNSGMLAILLQEYQRRDDKASNSDMESLAEGTIALGMREEVAACSWNAELVGETMGYGTHSKQYRSSGGSYFFVNGLTGKVDYISS